MKVLWISPIPVNYKDSEDSGSGGWINSLHKELYSIPEIELGISFPHVTDSEYVNINGTHYFPVHVKKESRFTNFLNRYFNRTLKIESELILRYLNVIDDFQPDIIHIWGCEHSHIQLVNFIPDKIIVHIQGILLSCVNAMFPPGCSFTYMKKESNFLCKIFKVRDIYKIKEYIRRSKIERDCFSKVKNWIGRTEWDENIVEFLSPQSNYFHGDEIMRKIFYEAFWQGNTSEKIIIHSNISEEWYKGIDLVLKTAKILSDNNIQYEWNVCGLKKNSFIVRCYAKCYDINIDCLNINFLGKKSSKDLVNMMIVSDMYVHPSYIESGCNAITEAQLIGVPVIAQFVGGLPTTLKNNTGLLISANDPYVLANKILSLKNNSELANSLSIEGRKLAHVRNDGTKICHELIQIYKRVNNNNK